MSDDLPEMGQRIRSAAAAAAASRAVYEDELLVRNRLIVEACDAGYAWRDVAEWSGVTVGRINQLIVARAGAAS